MVAGIVAIAMVANTLPLSTGNSFREAHAAEASEPEAVRTVEEEVELTQFATSNELMTCFDTTSENEETIHGKRVYFGKNQQLWYIVGKDEQISENNIVLFAASTVEGNVIFQDSQEPVQFEDYGISVAPNHYGASDLREAVGNIATYNFVIYDKMKQKSTTLQYYDSSSKSGYSLNDDLYLPYGNIEWDYITVGSNSAEGLAGDLRIDKKYWGNGNFWLRTADTESENRALVAGDNGIVSTRLVSETANVQPVFSMRLPSGTFCIGITSD